MLGRAGHTPASEAVRVAIGLWQCFALVADDFLSTVKDSKQNAKFCGGVVLRARWQ